MSRVVLKERQFESTGNDLGLFDSKDLETFDLQYTESDVEKPDQGGETGQTPKMSHVPNPKDDDPVKPESEDSKKSSGQSGQRGDSLPKDDSEEEEEQSSQIPDEWDPYGANPDEEDYDNNLDQGNDDESDDTVNGSSSQGGESSSGSEDGEEEGLDSGESGGDGSDEDDSESEDEYREPREPGESGRTSDDDSEEEYPGESDEEPTESPDEKGDSKQSGKSGDRQKQDGSTQEQSQGGDDEIVSYDEPEDGDYEDPDDDFDPSGDGDISSLSELQEAIDKMSAGRTSSQKQSDGESGEDESKQDYDPIDTSSPSDNQPPSDEERRAAKEALSRAIEDARKNGDVKEGESSPDDDILDGMGAGKLTNLFNPKAVGDWRARLDKLFDQATGFDIVTNPNLFNKKIEDAPPGREDEVPVLRDIVILMDWSGSMSALSYKACISHLDTMLKARNLNNVNFHIIPWGDTSVRSILPHYTKVKGRAFKKTIISKFSSDGPWSTHIAAGLEVASAKVKRPDAIIILTDLELLGTRDFENSSIAQSYVRKNRNKIIWALTPNFNKRCFEYMKLVCPYSYSHKSYVKFKKDKESS